MVTGLDPDQEGCAELRVRHPEGQFLPVAAGDGFRHTLYVCQLASRSSLFAPNVPLCSRFRGFSAGHEVVERRLVETVRLDDPDAVGAPDWLTMDVQGAERMVLEHGRSRLGSVLVAQLEVEFVPQYWGQPLFGDVDEEARRHRWMFHRFLGYGTRAWMPMLVGDDALRGVHQWLWADAVYVAQPDRWESLTAAQLRKLAVIMHVGYHSWDVSCAVLTELDRREGSQLAASYISLFENTTSEAPHLPP